MSDDLIKRLLAVKEWTETEGGKYSAIVNPDGKQAADRIAALEAQLAEMTRRRDEWRKKAEGFDAVRLALREKVGAPWPPHMSRVMWAGIAADEKKRADDAEARLAELTGEAMVGRITKAIRERWSGAFRPSDYEKIARDLLTRAGII